MTDSASKPGSADEKSAVGAVSSTGRRRLLRMGASAAPVIMTVASRPVLAQVACQAPSGFLSISTASHFPGPTCAGQPASYWSGNPSWGSIGVSRNDSFKTWFSPDLPAKNSGHDVKLSEVLDSATTGTSETFNVARTLVAALCNNKSLKVSESVLPLATIQAMWTSYKNTGSYPVNGTVNWNGPSLMTYLSSTMS